VHGAGVRGAVGEEGGAGGLCEYARGWKGGNTSLAVECMAQACGALQGEEEEVASVASVACAYAWQHCRRKHVDSFCPHPNPLQVLPAPPPALAHPTAPPGPPSNASSAHLAHSPHSPRTRRAASATSVSSIGSKLQQVVEFFGLQHVVVSWGRGG